MKTARSGVDASGPLGRHQQRQNILAIGRDGCDAPVDTQRSLVVTAVAIDARHTLQVRDGQVGVLVVDAHVGEAAERQLVHRIGPRCSQVAVESGVGFAQRAAAVTGVHGQVGDGAAAGLEGDFLQQRCRLVATLVTQAVLDLSPCLGGLGVAVEGIFVDVCVRLSETRAAPTTRLAVAAHPPASLRIVVVVLRVGAGVVSLGRGGGERRGGGVGSGGMYDGERGQRGIGHGPGPGRRRRPLAVGVVPCEELIACSRPTLGIAIGVSCPSPATGEEASSSRMWKPALGATNVEPVSSAGGLLSTGSSTASTPGTGSLPSSRVVWSSSARPRRRRATGRRAVSVSSRPASPSAASPATAVRPAGGVASAAPTGPASAAVVSAAVAAPASAGSRPGTTASRASRYS